MEGGTCDENDCEAKEALQASHTVVEIKIKTLDSQDYTCRVAKNVSVPDLKDQIAIITGVPSGSQRLICRGKVLKDEHILSAYDVEDGHTLHLVTRPIPSQSSHAVADGVHDDERDPFSSTTRDQHGHISRSVLVGTFNIPDRGGVILPEINRLFSSVLSTLRVGTSLGASNSTGNVNGSSSTVPHNIAENADARRQERSNNHTRSTHDESVSRDSDPATETLPSLRTDIGYLGSIPGVSRVRIVQQVVPNALRIASQYVNRMEQVLALSGETQTPTSTFLNQTEQQPPPVSGDGDSAAWTSMLRRITDLLSNQSASELRRLADRLEGESSLQTATAHGSILSAGILMERLGHLLLEVGSTMLMLRRDTSHDDAMGNSRNPYLVSLHDPDSTRAQNSVRDSRTDIASEQGSTYYTDNDDALHNMDIHIHAGLGPYLAARPQLNILSQTTQDGPPLNLNTRNVSESEDNHVETENVPQSLQDSSNSIPSAPAAVDHGTSLRALFSNGGTSVGDGATARRGGFFPLFARFQQLSPALFADFSLDQSGNDGLEQSGHGDQPSSDRDPVSLHSTVPMLHTTVQQLEQVLATGEGGSGGEVESLHPPLSCLEEPELEGGSDISMRPGSEDASTTNKDGISNVTEYMGMQDAIRPLLHALETPENVQRGEQSVSKELHFVNESRGLQEGTDTSLKLKCSAEMENVGCAGSDKVAATEPVIAKETMGGAIGSEAVVVGLRSNGFQPLLLEGSAYEHSEQASSNDLYGGADEATVSASSAGRTVLQDFLSTLASRTVEKTDGKANVDRFPQEWSLDLENARSHGLHLDSSGSSVVPMNSENNELASDVALFDESGEDNRSRDSCSNTQVLSLASNSSKKRLLLNPEVSVQEEESTDGRKLLMTTLEQSLTSKTSNSGDPNWRGQNASPEASPIIKRQKMR